MDGNDIFDDRLPPSRPVSRGRSIIHDRPFSRGRSNSIDRPISRGRSSSLERPFSRGRSVERPPSREGFGPRRLLPRLLATESSYDISSLQNTSGVACESLFENEDAINTSSAANSLVKQYVSQAAEAYLRGDWHVCIVYLRSQPLTLDSLAISILANSTYTMWRQERHYEWMDFTIERTLKVAKLVRGKSIVNVMKAVYQMRQERLALEESSKEVNIKGTELEQDYIALPLSSGEAPMEKLLLLDGSEEKSSEEVENNELTKQFWTMEGILHETHKAYERLFSGVVPLDQLTAMDYLHYSHLLLVEGDLRSAFRVIAGASRCGHGENFLIVLQSWTLMKRLGRSEREMEQTFDFLISAVTLESHPNNGCWSPPALVSYPHLLSDEILEGPMTEIIENEDDEIVEEVDDNTILDAISPLQAIDAVGGVFDGYLGRLPCIGDDEQQKLFAIIYERVHGIPPVSTKSSNRLSRRSLSLRESKNFNLPQDSIPLDQQIAACGVPLSAIYLVFAKNLQTRVTKFEKQIADHIYSPTELIKVDEQRRKIMRQSIAMTSEAHYYFTGHREPSVAALALSTLFQNDDFQGQTVAGLHAYPPELHKTSKNLNEPVVDSTLNYLALAQWMRSPEVWYALGVKISQTPFVLFAEDFLWEALRLSPLWDAPVSVMTQLMISCQRPRALESYLVGAIRIAPWNLRVRGELALFELETISVPHLRTWTTTFQNQIISITRIQALYRAYKLRSNWKPIYLELKALYDRHRHHEEKAEEKAKERLRNWWLTTWVAWKRYVSEWKTTKCNAATAIQRMTRRCITRHKYLMALWRMRRANNTYVSLVTAQYDRRRAKALYAWHTQYHVILRQRAAKVIWNVLRFNSYTQMVVTGMGVLRTVLNVRKKHIQKRIMEMWRKAYWHKLARHARITIRFWLRGLYRRQVEEEREQELEVVIEMITKKATVELQRNAIPLYREVMRRWKTEYNKSRLQRACLRIAKCFQRIFRFKKARQKLLDLHLRRESQRFFIVRSNFLLMYNSFQPWFRNAVVQRIQRLIRIFLAKRRMKRREALFDRIFAFQRRRDRTIKDRMIWLWQKHNFLERRNAYRAARLLCREIRIYTHRQKVIRCLSRKLRLAKFLDGLHFCHLRHAWRTAQSGMLTEGRRQALSRLFRIVRLSMLRSGWNRFQHSVLHQYQLKTLVDIVIKKPLSRKFWPHASESVRVLSDADLSLAEAKEKLSERRMHRIGMLKTNSFVGIQQVVSSTDGGATSENPEDIFVHPFMPWERQTIYSRTIMDEDTLSAQRAFRSWMTIYRRCLRLKRSTCTALAWNTISNVFTSLGERRVACIKLQSAARMWYARGVIRSLRQKFVRYNEVCAKCLMNRKLNAWKCMDNVVRRRNSARITLQRWIRGCLARRFTINLMERSRYIKQVTVFLQKSTFHHRITRRVLLLMLNKFLSRLQIRIATDLSQPVICDATRHRHIGISPTNAIGYESLPEKFKRLEKLASFAETSRRRRDILLRNAPSTHRLAGIGTMPSLSRPFFSDAFFRTWQHVVSAGVLFLPPPPAPRRHRSDVDSNGNNGWCGGLQEVEVAFLLASAPTLFLHSVTESLLRLVALSFAGRKIIFHGGTITPIMAQTYLADLISGRRALFASGGAAATLTPDAFHWPHHLATSPDAIETLRAVASCFCNGPVSSLSRTNVSGNEHVDESYNEDKDGLEVHFQAVNISLTSIEILGRALQITASVPYLYGEDEPTADIEIDERKKSIQILRGRILNDLHIDTASTGTIGMTLLLSYLGYCPNLHRLSITLSLDGDESLPTPPTKDESRLHYPDYHSSLMECKSTIRQHNSSSASLAHGFSSLAYGSLRELRIIGALSEAMLSALISSFHTLNYNSLVDMHTATGANDMDEENTFLTGTTNQSTQEGFVLLERLMFAVYPAQAELSEELINIGKTRSTRIPPTSAPLTVSIDQL